MNKQATPRACFMWLALALILTFCAVPASAGCDCGCATRVLGSCKACNSCAPVAAPLTKQLTKARDNVAKGTGQLVEGTKNQVSKVSDKARKVADKARKVATNPGKTLGNTVKGTALGKSAPGITFDASEHVRKIPTKLTTAPKVSKTRLNVPLQLPKVPAKLTTVPKQPYKLPYKLPYKIPVQAPKVPSQVYKPRVAPFRMPAQLPKANWSPYQPPKQLFKARVPPVNLQQVPQQAKGAWDTAQTYQGKINDVADTAQAYQDKINDAADTAQAYQDKINDVADTAQAYQEKAQEVSDIADDIRKNPPTNVPGIIHAATTIANVIPDQECGSCGCLLRNESGGCVACKPDEQCEIVDKIAPCSCPTGHVTNKWDKQSALEAKFCAGRKCSTTGCCGGVRYGRQEGGTEALNFATSTAIACASCTAGCGACAAVAAGLLIQQEMQMQIDSIAKALKDVYEDLGKKATEWGPDLREQLKNAVQVIALDIVKNGKISKDGQDAIAAVDFGRCTFGIEPGMSTYSSETCEFCCNCIPNMNAVRFYLAWRLDCRP